MPAPLLPPCDRRRFIRRVAVGLAGAGAIASPLRRVLAATDVTVGLDWFPNANHAGLFVAQSAAFYVFAKYAKLWEATRDRRNPPGPAAPAA